MTLTERCWTEVTVDGKSVFEGIIEKGKTENWQGKESVVVRAGNAGALDVTCNGKKLGKFGDNGEVVERRFTKTTKELKDTLPAAREAAVSAQQEKSTAGSDKRPAKATQSTAKTQ